MILYRLKLFVFLVNFTSLFPAKLAALSDEEKYRKAINTIKGGHLSRLYSGREADEGQFPFNAALFINEMFSCGGSIITAQYVLTAGHCVKYHSVQLIRARIGSIHRKQGGFIVEFVDKKVHHGYKMVGHRVINDIALLKLELRLKFTPNIQPIQLATKNPAVGTLVTMIGWGKDCPFKEESELLKFDFGTPKYPCNDISELCLSSPMHHGVCHGDSGGPAVFQNTLVGVTSYGDHENETCATEEPDVFASVAYFRKWIVENTKLKVKSSRTKL